MNGFSRLRDLCNLGLEPGSELPYVLSVPGGGIGVRPSSGAAAWGRRWTLEFSETLERADVAAPGDGRTPLNTYELPGYSQFSLRERSPGNVEV
jgi:hypothetical protein